MEMTMDNLEILKQRLQAVYSRTTVEHILYPRNTESIPNPDGFGVRQAGDSESMKIWLRVRNEIVTDAGFWTNGCAATIACGSMATELAKGRSVNEALGITAADIANALVDLPEGNFHCAEMAAGTLRIALGDCIVTQQQPWKKLYRR
jgi:nitrogen fixation protein NifU and related proteins